MYENDQYFFVFIEKTTKFSYLQKTIAICTEKHYNIIVMFQA